MPTITPKRPKAEAKISTTRILTKRAGLAASAIAAPLPVIPTEILCKGSESEHGGTELRSLRENYEPAEQVNNTNSQTREEESKS
jgi:hypothetical protein